jgi:acetyl-CoA carboxylase biotin carboxylase subunit
VFEKILIANRGEIALRIIRACREMGIATVAVYSQADQEALHVKLADESICIGPAAVTKSYLNMEALLSAAITSGAQAIHPGYGLLSENPRFADLCARCNLVFIGPSAEIIRRLGNKDEARSAMVQAGVPVIPGSGCLTDAQEAVSLAEQIGYPVLLKARAGGGGRGIRKVNSAVEMQEAYVAASREAQAAFGDGALYLEAFLRPVKHIEMQLLCDQQGQVVCLGERECSMQRNNQKLIEESPAPRVDEAARQAMIKWSTQAALATGYQGVGTIEYLMTQDGQLYFMEMNTRLQVEHPVTEMVTGLDLVKWQIRVAAGIPLNFTQKDIQYRGHAIECRINAENPMKNFLPGCGTVRVLHVPGGPGVRFDSALYQDYTVPPYYDSLVGKLVVHGTNREDAIRKMQAALCELVIEGIEHTGAFQQKLIAEKGFIDGSYTTDFLDSLRR